MAINQILAHGFQECVGASLLGDKNTDFTIKVQDTTFKCHSFVLSACSEFFRAMLESGMRESQENSATIGHVDENTFSTILHALYTGVDGLDQDNVYLVWPAVHRLLISHMVRCCEDFVKRNITMENYLKTYQLAKLLDSNSVLKGVANFMIKNFDETNTPETLRELSSDVMYTVLQSNELKAQSEDSVVESIITWVKLGPNSDNLCKSCEAMNASVSSEGSAQEIVVSGSGDNAMDKKQQADDRAKHMKRLFSVTRLYLVSPKCLEKALRFATARNNSSDVCQLLIDAMMYRQKVHPEHERFPWPTPAIHRAFSDKEHVMVFWNSAKKEFRVYRLQRNAICKTSIGCPRQFDKFLGFCVQDNHLFCSGHYSGHNYMYVITINDKSWIQICKNYGSPFESKHCVAHGSNVYALLDNQLYRFSPKYGSGFVGHWENCGYLSYDRRYVHTMIVFRDSLIIFPSNNSNIIWYNLKREKKRDVALIEGPVDGMVTFCNEDDTYTLQKNGFLRKIISPNAEELTFDFLAELWTGEWELRGAVLFLGQLFVFAFDLPADAQINVPSLQGVFQSAKVVDINSDFPCWPMVIPKSWLN